MSEQATLRTKTAGPISQTGQGLRLLVVDDDPLARNLMGLMLSPQGYQLDFACDGSDAIQAVKSRQYDLVFMDLILPDMNGRDVCREIRQWEAGKRHVPIVAVTAFDLPGQPLELVKAGMDDYIFKPYDLRGLTRLIRLYTQREGEEAPDSAGTGNTGGLAAAPVFDVQASLQDFADDVQSFQELLRDFAAGLPARMAKMRAAQQDGDMERLGREAHSLKGIAAGLGGMRLSRMSGQLSNALRNGQAGNLEERLRLLDAAIQELQDEVQAYLAS